MATTSERLQIIIEALNLSKDELNELQQDLEGTGQKAKQSRKGIGGMKVSLSSLMALAGSATAAFYALKKAFDMAEEGAQLELTQRRFERLATSIGTTASILEDDLNEATRGMLSRFEAMELATQLMALGLAKNHEEAVRLTSIASQLNMNMNQLVLTLTNQTTMRFDALGVSVDGFKEKVKELEEAGHDTNEAFKLAFMEQSEEQIGKVGSAADTAAGEFKEFNARIKDFKDATKIALKEAILPAIEASNERAEVSDRMNQFLESALFTQEETAHLLFELQQKRLDLAGITEMLTERERNLELSQRRMNASLRQGKTDLDNMAEAGRNAGEEIDEGLDRGIDALKSFSREALAARLINMRFEEAVSDKFISESELTGIQYLSEKLGVELPEDVNTLVDNFNTLGGELENLGKDQKHREIFEDVFGEQPAGGGARQLEAEFYITKGGETWSEIEDITGRTQEMILKANPTWDPNFDWFFEGVKLMVQNGGMPFSGTGAMQEAFRDMME